MRTTMGSGAAGAVATIAEPRACGTFWYRTQKEGRAKLARPSAFPSELDTPRTQRPTGDQGHQRHTKCDEPQVVRQASLR